MADRNNIAPLFQALGKEDFFTDAAINDALGMLGEPAKAFLLTRLRHEPLTKENTQAAIALAAFKDDTDVAAASLELLEKIAANPRHSDLAIYLTLNCAASNPAHKKRLEALANNPALPLALHDELRLSLKNT